MSTLKVGTIQDHANSNTALTIDSSGRVSTPVRVGFAGRAIRPYNSSNHVITTGVNVYCNEAFFNSGHFINSTASGQGEFTCPVAGAYILQANFLIDDNAGASELCRYAWKLNGAEKYLGYDNLRPSSNFEGIVSAGGVLVCSANDVITLVVTNGSFHGAAESSMSIYYLG